MLLLNSSFHYTNEDLCAGWSNLHEKYCVFNSKLLKSLYISDQGRSASSNLIFNVWMPPCDGLHFCNGIYLPQEKEQIEVLELFPSPPKAAKKSGRQMNQIISKLMYLFWKSHIGILHYQLLRTSKQNRVPGIIWNSMYSACQGWKCSTDTCNTLFGLWHSCCLSKETKPGKIKTVMLAWWWYENEKAVARQMFSSILI